MKNRGTKIAVVCPDFFGYPEQIKTSLSKLKYDVSLYDERPSNKVLDKILLRLTGNIFLKKSIHRHYDSIVKEIESNSIDIILLIDTEAINRDIVQKIRSRVNCEIILYMWDSIKNKGGFLEYVDLCDKAFTFDPEDAKDRKELSFLPLFYAEQYSKDIDITNKDIDVSFVGTLHSDRYQGCKKY
ncbi:hypothetical protein ACU6U9_10990 [Pseudomonas sp. HK3]